MRYFFHIGFNGSGYQGWQKLPQARSVQAVLEKYLAQILKVPVSIVGCGRTDTQVSATQFFFHLDVNSALGENLLFRLNKNLPSAIAVFDIVRVADDHHARMGATQRTYKYFIHSGKDPFLTNCSYQYDNDLNVEAMKEASAALLKYRDYSSFCRSPAKQRTTLCDIRTASWFHNSSGQMMFEISANRFLRGMVRLIVQRILDVGSGKLTVGQFKEHLAECKPFRAPESAPGHALYLTKVEYPFLELAPRTAFLNMLGAQDARWNEL